jgi:hypothetical protein
MKKSLDQAAQAVPALSINWPAIPSCNNSKKRALSENNSTAHFLLAVPIFVLFLLHVRGVNEFQAASSLSRQA